MVDVALRGACPPTRPCPEVRGKAKLDTGASRSFVAPEAARQLDLIRAGDGWITGIAGTKPIRLPRVGVEVSFPGRPLRRVPLFQHGVFVKEQRGRLALLGRDAMAGGDDPGGGMTLRWDGPTGKLSVKPSKARRGTSRRGVAIDAGDEADVLRDIRDRYWPHAYEADVLDAAKRVLRVGGQAPLAYKGIGMTGVVFCDARGIGYKAARDPRTSTGRHFLEREAAWLRVASTVPEIKAHVAGFRHYHGREAVLERECIKGAERRSSGRPDTRWDLFRTIAEAIRPYGFGRPEYKDDSFVWQPGRGWVLVDASMPVLRGKRLLARAVQILKGKRFHGERPRDVAWELDMEAGKTVDPLQAERLGRRLRALPDAEEFPADERVSSEAGFIGLEPLALLGAGALGLAGALPLDRRFPMRAFGGRVFSSALAAAAMLGASLFARRRHRLAARVAAGLAAGLGAGALLGALRRSS